jgi:hypothetical protein
VSGTPDHLGPGSIRPNYRITERAPVGIDLGAGKPRFQTPVDPTRNLGALYDPSKEAKQWSKRGLPISQTSRPTVVRPSLCDQTYDTDKGKKQMLATRVAQSPIKYAGSMRSKARKDVPIEVYATKDPRVLNATFATSSKVGPGTYKSHLVDKRGRQATIVVDASGRASPSTLSAVDRFSPHPRFDKDRHLRESLRVADSEAFRAASIETRVAKSPMRYSSMSKGTTRASPW